MIAAIFGAGLWLAICIGETPAAQTALIPMSFSYVLAGFAPIWLRHRHVRAQNRLLDRCRALLMAASHAVAQGDSDTAAAILVRIRRLEGLWRLGDSLLFRVSLALWAVGTAVTLCVLARYLGLLARHHFWSDTTLSTRQIQEHLLVAAAVSLFAPMEAMLGYCEAWRQPWTADDCGDRLWQMLYGSKWLAVPPATTDAAPCFDGLSPREIFGLGPTFTRRELDLARRRFVWDLHHDRLRRTSSHERDAREEALKQVNAAYDVLRPQAD